MKQKDMKKFTVVIFIVAIAVLVWYVYLCNQSPNGEDTKERTEMEVLLQYDMVNDYPKTARDTVKLHCRYLKYVYGDEFKEEATDDDWFEMNQQMRRLFAKELLEVNSAEKQLQALKDEVDLYELKKQKIMSYTLPETSQIEYNTDNGVEHAKMRVTIAMSIDGSSLSVDEEYLLYKDKEGNWKILGWKIEGQKQSIQEGDAKQHE